MRFPPSPVIQIGTYCSCLAKHLHVFCYYSAGKICCSALLLRARRLIIVPKLAMPIKNVVNKLAWQAAYVTAIDSL